MTEPTINHLRAAADLVRRGWVQKHMRKRRIFGPARYCALGAMLETDRPESKGLQVLADSVGRRRDGLLHYFNIVRWNDEPGRTAEEVASAMERAADEFEHQQKNSGLYVPESWSTTTPIAA